MDEQLDRIIAGLQEANVRLERLRGAIAQVGRSVEDHEKRMRIVERWKHHLTPILAALTFALGAVATEMLSRM